MDEYGREPCPHRIYADAGSAFAMGLIGGSIFQGWKGFRNAPKNQVMKSMLHEIQMRSSLTGVQFAAWGGMFSVIDCTLVAIRKKEDPLNSIAAGGLTGGLLCARMGRGPMIASAVFGALILAMIEGVGLAMNRFMSQMPMMAPPEEPQALKDRQQSSNVQSANFDPASALGLGGMAAHH